MTTSSTTTAIPSARWWRVGLVLFLVYLVAFIERANISFAAPAITQQLGLAATATGVLLSAFFWGYILTQVPGGWAASKVGPTRVIAVSLTIWGITSIVQAFAGSLPPLLIARIVMGLSEGVVWPAFGVMFVAWYPVAERARAAGLAMLALPLSSAIMAPTAGWLIATWNWQTMFVVQGIPAFILAAVVIIFLRDDPTRDRRLSTHELEHILANRATHSTESQAKSFATVLKSPAVWARCAVYFLWLTGFYSFGLWLPTVVQQLSSRGIAAVGLLSLIPFAIAGAALLLNARAADRSEKSKAWFIIPPLMLGAAALLVQQMLPSTLAVQMLCLVLAGVGVYAAFGVWWGWALEQIPPEQAGPGYGLINLFGNFGGLVGPVAVGWAAGGGPAVDGLYILGFFLLAGALVAFSIVRSASTTTRRSGTTSDLPKGPAAATPANPPPEGALNRRTE